MEDTEECFEMFPGIDFAEEEKSLLKEEMNGMLKNMDKEELKHFFSKEEFDENYKLIELNNYPFEKSLMLLKHVGNENEKKLRDLHYFSDISLKKRFIRMIVEEGKKKEGKDERLLVDLCECYLFWCTRYDLFNDGLLLTCVKCLLKVALNKEENEEARKEVEMALLALRIAHVYRTVPKELCLNEIKEIIQYHQEHHNLTQLAYQSAWRFSITLLFRNRELEEVIVNKLHFAREATRELEELAKCVDWKGKEEDRKGKDSKEENILVRWLHSLALPLENYLLRNEELAGLISCIVQIFRAAKDNCGEISDECVHLILKTTIETFREVDCLLKEGAVDTALGEMQRSTLNDRMTCESISFFKKIIRLLKGMEEDEVEEGKRRELKRKVFEKMEEEGYEEIIISLYEIMNFLRLHLNFELSLYITNYFVNV
ncbi:uncharacterized protein MONOS_17859 [Monocercomonoides exilis]|uniref:uncharacterized protein n=1 Tax=Monocercomonoides exilis TaxID=2049356 RepID=UPI00355A62B4|nr:hypothetical protein MONOS_17859 [Monocercomonoides exilis]